MGRLAVGEDGLFDGLFGNHYPSNKYIRVPCGNNVGLNVVPIWVSPEGCLVHLLKVFSWDLYGLRDGAA